MLFFYVQTGSDRYALEAERITEVLPLVGLKKSIRAPPGIAGMLNYHGEFVPVIDLSELALGRPAPPRLSTRIILTYLLEQGEKLCQLWHYRGERHGDDAMRSGRFRLAGNCQRRGALSRLDQHRSVWHRPAR